MEKAEGVRQIGAIVDRLLDRLRDDRYLSLRRAFAVWLGRVVMRRAGVPEDVSGIHELEEMNAMLEENVDRWMDKCRQEGRVEGRVEGRAEGRAEGRVEERREIVARMMRSNLTKSQIASFLSISEAELHDLIVPAKLN